MQNLLVVPDHSEIVIYGDQIGPVASSNHTHKIMLLHPKFATQLHDHTKFATQ